MKKIFFCFISWCCISQLFSATLSCLEPPNRFRNEIFANVNETDSISFGQNQNPLFNNRQENLLLDIFQPANDICTKRPLVIFMHGGWMQSGDRKGESGSNRRFAKRGYVAASIEYRLGVGGVFTPKNFATPGFMATQDVRAAIRFFRKNAAVYGIDTNFIYVGGCSAGAYAALFTAYLDNTSEIPPYVDAGALAGGLEGNSGNPGYSSKFSGVLSLSGGVLDTNWINQGNIPMVAVQCAADPIVPPGSDSLRNPNTHVGFLPSFGATAIKSHMLHLGISNDLLTFSGSCHCPHPGGPGGIDSTIDFFGKSIYNLMTKLITSSIAIHPITAGFSANDLSHLSPDYELYDLRGKKISLSSTSKGFSSGLYLARPKKN